MKKIHSMITAVTLGALVLPSCTTVDPYTGQRKTSNATMGTAIGAAGGALTGALLGKRHGKSRDYAIRGAILGGLGGGAVGYYMDQQEAQIRRQLQGTGVSVTRQGNDIILNMPSDITFRTGSSQIQPRFEQTLTSVALVLKKFNKTQISVIGHTDSVGTASYNQRLSVERARSVASSLNARGVAGYRTLISGRGESSPIASNNTAAGKAKNRRVELRIVPQQNQFR